MSSKQTSSISVETILTEIGDDRNHSTFSIRLNERLASLSDQSHFEEALALFEAAQAVLNFKDYWSLYNGMSLYGKVKEFRAAYIVATLAHNLNSLGAGEHSIANVRFNYYRSINAENYAVAVFRRYAESFAAAIPGLTSEDLSYWTKRAGITLSEDKTSYETRRDITVVEASTRCPWRPFQTLGGRLPWLFEALAIPNHRNKIYVSEIQNGELLVANGRVAVSDSSGRIQEDISVGEHPAFLQLKHNGPKGVETPIIEVDTAIMISDKWSHPNICHYLLDHFPRLKLYEMIGVDLERALVIGPSIKTTFQKRMLDRLNIRNYFGVDEPVQIHAAKVYSTNACRDLQLGADYGARWAVEFIREKLIIGTPKGRRLYISRSDSGRRKVLNEDDVFLLLQHFGFEKVLLSHLPFDEQVQIFAEASHIIGAHGAGLALTVFCNPGTHVLEIFHPLYFNRHMAVLAQQLELNWSILTGIEPDVDSVELEDITRWWEISRERFWGYSNMIVQIDMLRNYLRDVI